MSTISSFVLNVFMKYTSLSSVSIQILHSRQPSNILFPLYSQNGLCEAYPQGRGERPPLGYNAPVLHTILVLVCLVMRFPFFSCLDRIWWTSSFSSFFTRASLQTTFLVWIFLFSFHLLFPPWIFSSWLTIVVILGLGLPALWLCVMSYLTPSSRSGVSMTIYLSYGPKS